MRSRDDLALHVVVTGLMGIGKTMTATAAAKALGRPVHDSDDDIETLFGVSGRVLAEELGVEELHRLESAVLLGALVSDEPSVIAAAASVVEDPRCVEAMARRSTVVVLEAPLDVVFARGSRGLHRRSMSREELAAVAHRRAPLFAQVADLRLDATQSVSRLVDAIVQASATA
jgi:shikimate kinase